MTRRLSSILWVLVLVPAPALAQRPMSVVDLISGAYQARYLAGDPFPDGWEERVVDAAMAALGAPGPR